MKIEILYPEITNIYGDGANIVFLVKMFDDIVFTHINEEPYFVKNDVDFIYMGSHSDEYDNLIVEKLMPHKDRLMQLIENNKIVLFTGTAIELCGNHIEKYIELGVKWCQFLSELGEILKNNSQYLASTNLV